MKKALFLVCVLCMGCTDVMIKDDLKSARNAFHWTELKVGMSRPEVAKIMSKPDKKECHIIEGKRIIVWYYLTSPSVTLDMPEHPMTNYTPLIFIDNKLAGWGFEQYYHFLKIPYTTPSMIDKKQEPYKPSEEDWPVNEHRVVSPKESQKQEPSTNQTKPTEKKLEDTLKQKKVETPKKEKDFLWE